MTHGRSPVNDRGPSTGDEPPSPAPTTKSPGARGLFQLALNPDCGALQAYRLTHRDPALVAEHVLGAGVPDEGSEIALAIGLQFEAVLKKDDFAALVAALVEHGRLAAGAVHILDIDAAAPGTDAAALAAKVRLTEDALARHAAGDPSAPDLIWHPRLSLDLRDVVGPVLGGPAGPPITIEPDLIVTDRPRSAVRGRTPVPLRPGEVKAIRDRGAWTAAEALRHARLQGAVEVLALRSTLRRLGVAVPATLAPGGADLVLRRRIGMRPSVRSCRLDAELDTLTRVLGAALADLPSVLAAVPADTALDTPAAFAALPKNYTEHCRDHCALAAHCERLARTHGDAAVLGDEMAALLGTTPLPRLLTLVTGRERAATAEEHRLVAGFRVAQARLAPVLDEGAARLFGDASTPEVRRAS